MLKNNLFVFPIVIGALFYGFSLVVFWLIDSPHPYLGGIFVAFFAFEITFFYRFHKRAGRTTNKTCLK